MNRWPFYLLQYLDPLIVLSLQPFILHAFFCQYTACLSEQKERVPLLYEFTNETNTTFLFPEVMTYGHTHMLLLSCAFERFGVGWQTLDLAGMYVYPSANSFLLFLVHFTMLLYDGRER